VKSGVVFEQTPEEEAFHRWHNGKFHEVERLAAAQWRKALSELDLTAIGKEMVDQLAVANVGLGAVPLGDRDERDSVVGHDLPE